MPLRLFRWLPLSVLFLAGSLATAQSIRVSEPYSSETGPILETALPIGPQRDGVPGSPARVIRPRMSYAECDSFCGLFDMDCFYSCMWDDFGSGSGGTGPTGGAGSTQKCYELNANCAGADLLDCTPLSTVPGTVSSALDGYFQSKTKCGTKTCWIVFQCQCGSPMAEIGLCNL